LYNFTCQQTCTLQISGQSINETHTNVSLFLDGMPFGNFMANPYGWVYQHGELQQNLYSIWWVYVPNIMVFAGVEEGDVFHVWDPTGFLEANRLTYDYEIEDKFVFYPVLPQHTNLFGAQASFEASLYKNASHQKVGTVIFDTTSGAIEQAEMIVNGHWCRLLLVETSYGISRNRIVLLVVNIIVGLVAWLLLWMVLWLRQKRVLVAESLENANANSKMYLYDNLLPVDTNQRNEFFALLLAGFVCSILDIVDTWFYHKVGEVNSMLIDAVYIAMLVAICVKWKYGVRWVFPAFIEFIYAGPFRGRMMIPYMGTTLAWIAVVWGSGVAHRRIRDRIEAMSEASSPGHKEPEKRSRLARIMDSLI
jgi:hypothetical protein